MHSKQKQSTWKHTFTALSACFFENFLFGMFGFDFSVSASGEGILSTILHVVL